MTLKTRVVCFVGLICVLLAAKVSAEEPSKYFLNKWIEIPFVDDEHLLNIRQLNNYYRHYLYVDTHWEQLDSNVWRWSVQNNGSIARILFVPGQFEDEASMRSFPIDGQPMSAMMQLEILHAIYEQVNEAGLTPYSDPE